MSSSSFDSFKSDLTKTVLETHLGNETDFTRLSIAENIINLFLIFVSQIEISQLFVLRTFPVPKAVFNFKNK